MRRALVLAGGGSRGSYQVGMLQELVINQELDFSIIRGVSVGALNASFLAQAPAHGKCKELKKKVKALHALWTNISGNKSIYEERAGFAGIAAGADSLFSLEPLKSLIKKNISLNALRNSGRDFAVGTVSLVSGKYNESKPNDDDFIDKLIASASIPFVFPYVDFKSKRDVLVDGGIRNITPLSSAFAAKPDEIYILLTSRLIRNSSELPDSSVHEHDYTQWDDNWTGTKISGLDVLKRTIDILTDEIYLDDIRGALKWNKIADSIISLENSLKGKQLPADVIKKTKELSLRMKEVKKRSVKIFVIAPTEWFGKENNSTDFSPELIKQAIGHGQEVASDRKLWVWHT